MDCFSGSATIADELFVGNGGVVFLEACDVICACYRYDPKSIRRYQIDMRLPTTCSSFGRVVSVTCQHRASIPQHNLPREKHPSRR